MSRYPKLAQDSQQAIALVNEWNDACGNPFGKLFKPEHIRKAWQPLYE
ncbi:hypothetical protein [Nostoc commune]|nr:hypothetical protein [Nostoc commune]